MLDVIALVRAMIDHVYQKEDREINIVINENMTL